MDLDPLSIVAPARVKVLLLPVGHVRQSRFASFVGRLQQVNIVRLGDVSPDSRPHRTMFSPLAFPEGLVLYDLSTTFPPPSHLVLSPFELYREPLVIVGIADANKLGLEDASHSNEEGVNTGQHESVSRVSGLKALVRNLEDFLDDYPNALVHQILVFDHDDSPLPERIYSVPSPARSKTTTIKTVMCDLTSRLLAEMATYAKSLQSLSFIESPRLATGEGSNDTASAVPPHMAELSKKSNFRSMSPAGPQALSQQRMSMPASLASRAKSGTSTPGSRPISPSNGATTPPKPLTENAASTTHQSPSRDPRHGRAGSRGRGSGSGLGAGSLGDRNKGKGRIGILFGAMYLLAGRWPDAVRELVSNAAVLKSNSDYLWHAKAMDYVLVCLLMYAWAGMDFRIPENFFPGTERPGSNSAKSKSTKIHNSPEMNPSDSAEPTYQSTSLQALTKLLPDLVNTIHNLYARAWTFTEDKLPPLAFCQSSIRFAKLLTAIHLAHGVLNDHLLRHLVLNTDRPISQKPPANRPSFTTGEEIVNLLFRAYPGSIAYSSMNIADCTTIFAGIASILSELNFHRRKALVLKDLMSGLLPALVQARKVGAAEMGVHPAASLASLNASISRVPSESPLTLSDGSEQGMRQFLLLVCQTYGIIPYQDIGKNWTDSQQGDRVKNLPSIEEGYKEAVAARALKQASSKASGSLDLKIDILRSCIDVCEALPDLGGVLQFSAELLRLGASGIAPGPDDSTGSPSLATDEQVRIVSNISRTLSAAQQLGIEHPEAEYWDDFLIRGIELAETLSPRSLQPHAKDELEIAETIASKTEKDPFIYNPFLNSKPSAATENLLVAEEEAFFRVTLQNLFDFDVVVERIKVFSDSEKFEPKFQSTLIGPYRTQTIILSGTSRSAGSLNVHGCLVKIRGCKERLFLTFTEPWSLKPDVKDRHAALAAKSDCLPTSIDNGKGRVSQALKGPVATTINFNVLSAQPKIALKSISISQSAIMLLEGEAKSFRITLHNTSRIDTVDLLLLSFDDSLASRRRNALLDKELSPTEIYELELAAAKPALSWKKRDNLRIDVGSDVDFQVEVIGRCGLTTGSIQVDYCHLGVPRAEIQDRFYTHQLMIPMTMTVNPSVRIQVVDIVNLSRTRLSSFNPERDHNVAQIHEGEDVTKYKTINGETSQDLESSFHLPSTSTPYCLLLLDVRNSWSNSLTISLSFPGLSPTATTIRQQMLESNTTTRIPVPIPQIYVPQPRAPIPSLNSATKRQFVVSTTTDSKTELAIREGFWYREALLERLGASWKEELTGRTGEVDLRTLQLTPHMITALKLPELDISMSISSAEPSATVHQSSASEYTVPTTTFLNLHTRINNRTSEPIRPLLRLQPTLANQPQNIALDLNKKFLINGLLQRALPEILPGETKTVETGFMVLSQGIYEWGAVVEEVVTQEKDDAATKAKVGRKRAATGELDLLGDERRRVWVMDGKCIIRAREEDGDEDMTAKGVGDADNDSNE